MRDSPWARQGIPTALGRRNPTVKLGLLLVFSLAMLFVVHVPTMLVWYLGAVCAARWGAGLRWGLLLRLQVPFAAFALSLVMVNALSRPGTEIWPGAFARVTYEGVALGLALALRSLVIGVLSLCFVVSTPPRELLVSLMQHARVSPRYAFALLAGHRMLFALPQRWALIQAAQAVRAPVSPRGVPQLGVRHVGRCAFALLVGCIRHSERTALALETRGLGSGVRTIWRPVALTRHDTWFAVALCLFAVVTGVGARLL